MRGTILVVDDDPSIRRLLAHYLRDAGYEVALAGDGPGALAALEQSRPAAVVLDLMLPGTMSGWDVCREVRAFSRVPVLMLTSLGADRDQIAGLEMGADDYVVKPFSPAQVVARVRALLRRSGQDDAPLHCGPISLDPASQLVAAHGRRVDLTPRQYALLEALLRQPNRVISRAELLDRCWEPGFHGVDRVVDVHIGALRRKLGRAGNLIIAVRGQGYRLEGCA